MVKITEENFVNVDPSILMDAKWYPQIEDMVVSIDAAVTPDYSKKYALLLQAKLEPVVDAMPKDLQQKYFCLVKVLLLGSLLAMSDQEKERFFRESILDAFWADFVNVRNSVEFVFAGYYAAQDIIEGYRKLFLKGLSENIQVLGPQEIKVPGEDRPKPPILKNWFLDYIYLIPLAPSKTRGRIEEGKYMTVSLNASRLSVAEKNVLLKVLELYDWLSFSPLKYDPSFPEDKAVPTRILDESEYQPGVSREVADIVNRMRGFGTQEKLVSPVPSRFTPPPRAPRPLTPPVFRPSPPPPPPRPVGGAAPRTSFATPAGKEDREVDLQKALDSLPTLKPIGPSGIVSSAMAKMTLSQAIANAGQEELSPGNIRVGQQETRSPAAKPSAPVVAKASPPPKPLSPLPKQPIPQAPKAPPSPKPVSTPYIPPSSFYPKRGDESASVVDLTKRSPLAISSINRPEFLERLELKDFSPIMFDSQLQQIKQRIVDLSKEFHLSIKDVVKRFYRSPLYNLYVGMAVAIMNDSVSPDPETAYAKVAKNYQDAKKEYLLRQQFLSMNRFKKELAELEERI